MTVPPPEACLPPRRSRSLMEFTESDRSHKSPDTVAIRPARNQSCFISTYASLCISSTAKFSYCPLTTPLPMRIASTWSRDAFVGDLRREFHRVGATELARGRIPSVAALPTSGDRYVIAEARGKTRRFALIKAHISDSRRLSGTPQRTRQGTRWLTNSGVNIG